MPSIWHDHGMPSFLGIPPSYSFFDQAEVVIVVPENYTSPFYMKAWKEWHEPWRQQMHFACIDKAQVIWQRNKPWYCNL